MPLLERAEHGGVRGERSLGAVPAATAAPGAAPGARALANSTPGAGRRAPVCTFPLNRKSWLMCSSYFSMNVLYYHLKKKKMIIDWSPFVIWSLFNLFKGFCIQKFTFLCIFFLCKN